jgi:hypothetical protein
MVNQNITDYLKVLSPTPSRLSFLNDVFYPVFTFMPVIFILLFGISIFLAYNRNLSSFAVLLVLVLFFTAVLILLLVWHTDTNELTRHALQGSLQLRLASWLCLLVLADTFWAKLDKIHQIPFPGIG